MKKPAQFTVGVEVGSAGYRAAWCFDLPGCYAVIPPGADQHERIRAAILEFLSWSHNRAANLVEVRDDLIDLIQVVTTGLDVRSGMTSAFFGHDMEPPANSEFPQWANAHDLAVDEIRALARTLPAGLLGLPFGEGGRTPLEIVRHAAATELWYANQLAANHVATAGPGLDGTLRSLSDAHLRLQQVVCDVPSSIRVRTESQGDRPAEDWSVRKVMRSSIWHLRYHVAEIRGALNTIWLA